MSFLWEWAYALVFGKGGRGSITGWAACLDSELYSSDGNRKSRFSNKSGVARTGCRVISWLLLWCWIMLGLHLLPAASIHIMALVVLLQESYCDLVLPINILPSTVSSLSQGRKVRGCLSVMRFLMFVGQNYELLETACLRLMRFWWLSPKRSQLLLWHHSAGLHLFFWRHFSAWLQLLFWQYKCNWALWCHSIAGRRFGDKHQNLIRLSHLVTN